LLPDTSLRPYTKDDLRWSDGLRNHVVDELYALREAMRDRHLQFATEQLPELENEVWSSRAALAERAGLAREAEAALMVAAEYGSPTFTHDHDQEAERDLSKQMTM